MYIRICILYCILYNVCIIDVDEVGSLCTLYIRTYVHVHMYINLATHTHTHTHTHTTYSNFAITLHVRTCTGLQWKDTSQLIRIPLYKDIYTCTYLQDPMLHVHIYMYVHACLI